MSHRVTLVKHEIFWLSCGFLEHAVNVMCMQQKICDAMFCSGDGKTVGKSVVDRQKCWQKRSFVAPLFALDCVHQIGQQNKTTVQQSAQTME